MRSESSTLCVYCFEQILSPLFEGKFKRQPLFQNGLHNIHKSLNYNTRNMFWIFMASTTMVSEKYPEGRGRKSTSADLMKPTKTWVVNTTTEAQCGTASFLSAVKLQCYLIAVQCERLVKVLLLT